MIYTVVLVTFLIVIIYSYRDGATKFLLRFNNNLTERKELNESTA